MKPYHPSPYQVGAMPQREVSPRTALVAAALFLLMATCMAFVGANDPATCSAPVTVASK